MRKYEVMYIVKASLEDDARQEVIETLHNIITNNGGNILSVDDWGIKDFAYRIDDMFKGHYVVTTFEANNEVLSEFNRLTKINRNVVRHMVISLEE